MLYPKDPELTISKSDSILNIEWNWSRKQGIGFVVLSIFMATIFWCIAIAPNPKTGIKPDSGFIPMAIVASIYVIPLLTFGLANLLNRTVMKATRETLSMTVRPIPVFRRKSISGEGLQQFFVRSVTGKAISRSIFVMDSQSHCIRFVSRMPSEFATYQICHELQDFYGLEDLAVYGQNTLPHQPSPRKT